MGDMVTIRAQRAPALESHHFRRALTLIVVAFGIWILDITKVLCDPASPIQGHAVWHVLGAAATWFLFLYYRSERTTIAYSASTVSGSLSPSNARREESTCPSA